MESVVQQIMAKGGTIGGEAVFQELWPQTKSAIRCVRDFLLCTDENHWPQPELIDAARSIMEKSKTLPSIEP